jgi:UMF1 family MFS transporter
MTEYADRRGRWGWLLYDWASQPYHTLVTTFVFAPYFASAVAPDPVTGQEMWGWANTVGGLTIAVAAPFLGAMADATGPRKPWLALFSVFYMIGAWLLWFAVPGDPNPVWVLAAFVIGLIGVEFATVFNNAMMPLIVPKERIGALSGNGWALGYIGGVVALAIMLLLFAENADTGKTMLGLDPLFGLDAEAREGTRAVGPITAIWYAVFIIPLFLYAPDAPRRAALKGSAPSATSAAARASAGSWSRRCFTAMR